MDLYLLKRDEILTHIPSKVAKKVWAVKEKTVNLLI